ncbi:cytochrome c1 [Phenylobacterium hankyongense]|uniref:Cytochrome c1 n=1 Tax=Phenylobacterium hankyongense TaxID=1813876 RepID=A0A328AZQ6_9CAUL|nr:cytochrome c1 [Phenylobacterium hankyongense]RAK60129.1 cytochrome c1 [Phenylobacterium hankyongense]
MLRKVLALAALGLAFVAGPSLAATTHEEPKDVHWSFEGPVGKFDTEQLQRGYKVYREVCSACHAMNLMYFRNLGQKGGPFYDPKYPNSNENPYVKSLAKDIQVPDIDSETGDVIHRPATPADKFPSPFPNEPAARASNGGALPPDLSVIAKAREGGPAYVYSILTGFGPPPKGLTVPPGKYYNPFMPGDLTSFWTGPKDKVPEGGFIAMPPPLAPGKVTFDDGKPSTVAQQADDVAAFLMWAAEPKMEERKQFGLGAMIYLLIFTGLLYASYRRIWRNVAH